jgi:general nucleoside transport system permease protein
MFNDFFQAAMMISLLSMMLRISTPVLLAALGELVAERSGVMNLGVEGIMLTGAFVGFVVAEKTGSFPWAILASILAGGLMGVLMSFMSVSLKLNQTVVGLGLNLLASGLTFYLYRISYVVDGDFEIPRIEVFQNIEIPLLSKIPFLGPILFNQNILTYFALLMVPAIWFFLYRTRHGLLIRGLGEYPRAVDVKGVSVDKFRYLAVAFGGMMAGLGGAFLTLGSSGIFVQEMSAGRGWLAIVIVIAGNWQPGRILLASLIFALLDAFQLQVQAIGVQIPYQILLALPYVFAILALMGSRARSVPPGSLGEPYSRE